jgi:2-iminoacetate synthase
LQKVIRLIKPYFSQISIEIQPLDQDEYEILVAEGVHAVLVYQETYHEEDYKKHHPKGKKSNFQYRIQTPDRLGKAGIHKMGLGVLIGLEDWRVDCFLQHCTSIFRKTLLAKYLFDFFSRLRPFSGGLEPKVEMSDRELVQLICAYRIFDEEVELSISTRENEIFRDNIIKLGITSMSAGSKTNPGGYVVEPESLEQFEISDERSPQAIASVIQSQGYEPVWKNWDRLLQ